MINLKRWQITYLPMRKCASPLAWLFWCNDYCSRPHVRVCGIDINPRHDQ